MQKPANRFEQKRERAAILGIIFVNVMWGISFVASKYAMTHGLGPLSLAMIRYLATPVLLFFILLSIEKKVVFPKKDWALMALSGLFGITIYFFCENHGVLYTSVANASLIIAAIPVFTMLSGVIFHHRKPSALQWLGGLLSLVGVYLVMLSGQDGNQSLKGNLMMLGACISWVVYIEITDILVKTHSSLEITFWQSVFAGISLIPFGLSEGIDFLRVDPVVYLIVIGFLTLICSGLCFALYAFSIAALSPVRSAIFINLNPLVAVLGGVFLLGEKVTAVQLIGGVVILFSIFLVNTQKSN